MSLDLRIDTATASELISHLVKCSEDFVPSLSSRVDIPGYAQKIAKHALRFEAWEDELVGLIAAYRDVAAHKAFITNVSVLGSHRSRGVASSLLKAFLMHCSAIEVRQIVLEVDAENLAAVSLYRSHGFIVDRKQGKTMTMILNLGVEK